MIHGKLWNQISLLKLNEQHRLRRKSVFNIRNNEKIDYFPTSVSMFPEKKASMIISPDNKNIKILNTLVLSSTLFLSFYIPFEIAFEMNDYELNVYLYLVFFLVFFLEFVTNLNIALYNQGNLVLDRKKIALFYAKGWLFIDLVGLVSLIFTIVTIITQLKQIWIIQMLRMVFLVKVFKLNGIIKTIQDGIRLKFILGFLTVFEIVLKELLVAHILACAFYSIGRNESLNHPEAWINSCYLESGDITELYITALYWSITTLSTVGYGDIKAKTNNEFIFVIFSMILACSVFGYFIGNLEEIISNFSGFDSKKKEVALIFNSFCRKNNIPECLKSKAKAYLTYIYENKKKNETDESEILQQLSNDLQESVCVYSRGFIFNNFFAFSRFDKRFIKKVMIGIALNCYSPQDIIFEDGEKSRDLYFITNGDVFLEDISTGCYFMELNKSCRFGDFGFFLGKPRCCTAKSKHFVEVFTILWESFSKLLEEDPDSQEFISKLEGFSDAEAYSELRVDCYFCGNIGHIMKECPSFDFGRSELILNLKNRNASSKCIKVDNPALDRRILPGKKIMNTESFFDQHKRQEKTELDIKRPRHSLFAESSDEFEKLDLSECVSIRSLCFNTKLMSNSKIMLSEK